MISPHVCLQKTRRLVNFQWSHSRADQVFGLLEAVSVILVLVYTYCTYSVNVAKPIVNLRFRDGLYNPCMVIYDDLIQNGMF